MEETSSDAAVAEPTQKGKRQRSVSGLLTKHEPQQIAVPCGASLGYLCESMSESSELQPGFLILEHQKSGSLAQRLGSSSTQSRCNTDGSGNWTTSNGPASAQFITLSAARQRGLKLVYAEWLRDLKAVHGRSHCCEIEARGHGDQFPRERGCQPVHSSNQMFQAESVT